MSKISPCSKCRKRKCKDVECKEWRKYYTMRQSYINAYAVSIGLRNPCDHCSAEKECTIPCLARKKYWEARMKILREVLC